MPALAPNPRNMVSASKTARGKLSRIQVGSRAAGPLTGASELLMRLLAESHIWKTNPGGKLHLLPRHVLFERDSCLLSKSYVSFSLQSSKISSGHWRHWCCLEMMLSQSFGYVDDFLAVGVRGALSAGLGPQ